ncbi:translationally-controlled tumor protein homolog [Porites lutea]|uniref:translationally-controlled tumor protein homolog n=1 Tax=Porites lutea TaxID=51062 RepID=UPI003CC5A9D6
MKIFKDLFSGDELFTDVYKMTEVDGIFYEVEGKVTTEKSGDIDESLIGGNKSAEDTGGDDVEENAVTGVDIVLANKLKEVGGQAFPFSKKDYQKHCKAYMKKLLEHLNPEEKDKFQADAKVAMQKIWGKFKDLQFFRGESEADFDDAECMLAILEYRDNTPYMLFFKHGLVEEKM